jgi:hypothetical protein
VYGRITTLAPGAETAGAAATQNCEPAHIFASGVFQVPENNVKYGLSRFAACAKDSAQRVNRESLNAANMSKQAALCEYRRVHQGVPSMRAATKLRACAVVLTAMLGSSPAAAAHMTDFDLNKLDNWSDALAVCDVTRFLLTNPNLNADAILVTGRDNTHTALYRPLFAPPTNFFSDAMREAYTNVRKAGFVTLDSYSKSRLHYATVMLDAYRSATNGEKRYMVDQMELCYHLAARAGVKLNAKNK